MPGRTQFGHLPCKWARTDSGNHRPPTTCQPAHSSVLRGGRPVLATDGGHGQDARATRRPQGDRGRVHVVATAARRNPSRRQSPQCTRQRLRKIMHEQQRCLCLRQRCTGLDKQGHGARGETLRAAGPEDAPKGDASRPSQAVLGRDGCRSTASRAHVAVHVARAMHASVTRERLLWNSLSPGCTT